MPGVPGDATRQARLIDPEREEVMVRRRSLLATVMAVALLGTGLVGVAAQEATPAAATFADTMGLPELRVRSRTRLRGVASGDAGRSLPADPGGRGRGRRRAQLHATARGDERRRLHAVLTGPPAASSEAMEGTPGAEAGPPEGEGEDGAPEWYFQTAIAGARARSRGRPRRSST